MPLARIISHSHVCARELAIDLLARGYRVEIVSPDRIPDNFADLELRVDAAPGDQLIASVEAHNGDRSASLDFVHHLKAPMMDFIRRPLQPATIQEPVNSDHLPSAIEKTALAKPLQPAPKSTSPTSETVRRAEPAVIDLAPSPRPRPVPENRPIPVPARSYSVKASAFFRPLVVSAKALSEFHPKPSEWRAALILTGIVLLALSMWIGMRRGEASAAASAVVPAPAPTKKIGADPATSNFVPPAAAAASAQSATSDHAANLSPASGAVPIANLRLMARERVSRKHDGDYVARDTVVYFDQRSADEAAARAKLARGSKRHYATASNSRSGVIAANSVTYFNNKPAPKTTKQDASLKPASTQN